MENRLLNRAMFASVPLGREEEAALLRRWRSTGDRRAADRIARAHLSMVLSIAIRHRGYGVPVAELVAEGNCGIVQALQRFDPERDVRFGTYARYWIRACMFAYIMRSWSVVGGSTGAVRSRMFFRLRRERRLLANLLGDADAVDTALAERLGISRDRLRLILVRIDQRDISLDVPVDSSSSTRRIDMLSAANDPEDTLAASQLEGTLGAAVRAALRSLDARERYIVENRMMASPDEERSLSEMGRCLGVSRERARQLEARAARKLRAALAEQRDPGVRSSLAEMFPKGTPRRARRAANSALTSSMCG